MTAPGSSLAFSGLWAAAGFGFGLGYFAMLRRGVTLFSAGQGRRLPAAALALGRLAAAIGFLGLAARCGALPLLTAFLGFLAARSLALRTGRKAA